MNGVIKMYSANEIAVWFIYKNNAENKEREAYYDEELQDVYEGISHLKLQKLLYYAQGVSLSINEKELFEEKILAWNHGPVINEVYQKYKSFKNQYITVKSNKENDEIVEKIENDSKTKKILDIVYDNFAIYTAWQLREMTHEENSPWDITVKEKEINACIELDVIKKYFNEVVMES